MFSIVSLSVLFFLFAPRVSAQHLRPEQPPLPFVSGVSDLTGQLLPTLEDHSIVAESAESAARFVPAPVGCAMAHCDRTMSDWVRLSPPSAPVGVRWRDTSSGGSRQGLGCVANGVTAACTFGGVPPPGPAPYLKTYDADGRVLWTSGDVLNPTAMASAPLIDTAGGVIAADTRTVVRFGPGGDIVWRTTTPGGIPISPVVTDAGVVVLATAFGPISAFDSGTGALVESLQLVETIDGRRGRFETFNTPAVRGSRIYVVTELRLYDGPPGAPDPRHHGRLYAIDIDPAAPSGQRLWVAWFLELGARTSASPLLIGDVLYFDVDRPAPGSDVLEPQFLAVRDTGAAGTIVWSVALKAQALASAARDPRGGLWIYARSVPELVRLSEASGAVLQRINTGSLTPSSAMTIAGRPIFRHPVMLLSLTSAGAAPFATYVTAVDLVEEVTRWTFQTGSQVSDMAMGQFPIVQAGSTPVVVFSTNASGTWAIGAQ